MIKVNKREIKEKLKDSHDFISILLPKCGKEFIEFIPKGITLNNEDNVKIIEAISRCLDPKDDFNDHPTNYVINQTFLTGGQEIIIGLDEGIYPLFDEDIKSIFNILN